MFKKLELLFQNYELLFKNLNKTHLKINCKSYDGNKFIVINIKNH